MEGIPRRAPRRRLSTARLSILLTAVIVAVLGTADHALGGNAFLRLDGECGRHADGGFVSATDIAEVADLSLPRNSVVLSSCRVDREWLGSSDVELDAEAHVHPGIDAAVLAQHFLPTHQPTTAFDLADVHPHWSSALHRLHGIRFFTNKLHEGENPATFVVVGSESDGSVTLVADLLGGTDNL